MSRILVADDEQSMRDMLAIALKGEGHEVVTAADGDAALREIEGGEIDLAVSDIRMPELDGLDLLRAVKRDCPDTEVVLITAYASTDSAIEALRLGAYDYITKPFDVEELKVTVRHALERRELRRENVLLKRELTDRHGFDELVGKSEPMRRIFDLIRRVADSETNVLIIGESGTGKELVAHAVHRHSDRAEAPFVTVNCAALPGQLLESELFGHVKGAFTGADRNKEGLFEAAAGGTLLLDEIGDMPIDLQPKLLRVLEDQRVRRVGSTREKPVDVRVLASTNKDLRAAVSGDRFREDLFYRLNVIQVELPSLRERKDDIPLLVEHFLERYSAEAGKEIVGCSPEAVELLQSYDWPGNVRELVNAIRHAVTMESQETIQAENLPYALHAAHRSKASGAPEAAAAGSAAEGGGGDADAVGAEPGDAAGGVPGDAAGETAGEPCPEVDLPDSGIDLERHLDDLKRRYMLKALQQAGGVQKHAAEILGMSFRSFRYYMDKYGLKEDL